jgi:hypothetical protein
MLPLELLTNSSTLPPTAANRRAATTCSVKKIRQNGPKTAGNGEFGVNGRARKLTKH